MALTFTNHVAPDLETTTSAVQTIPAVALTGGRLHLLAVTADLGSNAALGNPTSVVQAGATWTLVGAQAYSTSDRRRVALYRCQPASNVGAADIVVTWPATTVRRVAAVAISNAEITSDAANNGAACIIQFRTNFNNAAQSLLTATLDSVPVVGDVTFGAGSAQTAAANSFNPGTRSGGTILVFDELSDTSTASGTTNNIMLGTEVWDLTEGNADAVVDMSRTSGTNTWALVGVEVRTNDRRGSVVQNYGFISLGFGAPSGPASGVVTLGFTAAASGLVEALGTAVASLGFTAAGTGVKTVGATAVTTLGFIAAASGIPDTPGGPLYGPDDFTGSNGTPAPDQPPWIEGSGNWEIQGNELACATPFGSRVVYYGDTIDGDQWIEVTFVTRGDASTLYIGLRYQNTSADLDADGCYVLRITSGGLLSLRKNNSVIGDQPTWSGYPGTVRFEAEGEALRVYENDILVIDTTDPGTSRLTGAPAVGVQPGGSNTTRWDDLSVGDFTGGGGGEVEGTASASFAVTATASGTRQTSGAAATSLTLTAAANGVRGTAGTGSLDIGFAATAQGVSDIEGTAVASFALDATATGTVTVPGSASTALGFSADASGDRGVFGAAFADLGFAAAGSGEGMSTGLAEATFGFIAVATAQRAVVASASSVLDFVAQALGVTDRPGTADLTFSFGATASGVRGTSASALADLGGITATAVGVRSVVAQAAAIFDFTGHAQGAGNAVGSGSAVLGFTAAASGERTVTGTAQAAFAVVGASAGHVGREGSGISSFGFAAVVDGERTVLATAALTLSFDALMQGEGNRVGSALADLGAVVATATGLRTVNGSASSSLGFGATAIGGSESFGSAIALFGFTATMHGITVMLMTGHRDGGPQNPPQRSGNDPVPRRQ